MLPISTAGIATLLKGLGILGGVLLAAGSIYVLATVPGPNTQTNLSTMPDTPTPALSTPEPEATATPAQPNATPVVVGKPGTPADCAAGWQFFDNTLLKYTLCLPPEWGFHDGTTAERLTTLSPTFLAHVTAFSAERFPYPWKAGTPSTAEAVRASRAISITLALVPPIFQFAECAPRQPISIGGLDALSCEEAFSVGQSGIATLTPSGQQKTIKILLPLLSAPIVSQAPNVDTIGYRLYIRVDAPNDRLTNERKIVDSIIETLRIYR